MRNDVEYSTSNANGEHIVRDTYHQSEQITHSTDSTHKKKKGEMFPMTPQEFEGSTVSCVSIDE